MDNVINQAGEKTEYQYNAKANKVTNEFTTYSYGTYKGLPISIPVYHHFDYPPESYTYHNLISVTHPTGDKTIYDYVDKGQYCGISKRQTIINNQPCLIDSYNGSVVTTGGIVKKYYFSGSALAKEEITQNGKLLSVKEYTGGIYPTRIATTTYSHEYGNVVRTFSVDTPIGPQTVTITNTDTLSLVEKYTYDDYNNVTSHEVDGKTFTYTYDNMYGLLTSEEYKKDSATTVRTEYTLTPCRRSYSSKCVYENGQLKEKTEFTGYDAYGNNTQIKSYVNANSFITTDLVYKNGSLLQSKKVDGIQTEAYTYDIMGRALSHTDGNGNISSYESDSLGRVTKITNPDGSFKSYNYIVGIDTNRIVETDELGIQTTYDYNLFGKLTSKNRAGAIETIAYHPTFMKPMITTDSSGIRTTYTYDHLGRLIALEKAGGLYKETYQYLDADKTLFNKVIKTVVGDSSTPSIVNVEYYNALGLKIKDGYVFGGVERLNTYTYNYIGNKLTELSPKDTANGLAYTNKYEYDYASNVVKLTNSIGNVSTQSYDMLKRKVSSTDPKGNTSYFAYDSFGRTISTQVPFDDFSNSIKTYAYDGNGNVTEQYQTIQKSGEPEKLSKISYSYDNMNRLASVRSYDNNILVNFTEYSYDSLGRNTQLRTANGSQITFYTYDAFGNTTSIKDPLNQTEYCTYRADGKISQKTDKNGTVTTYTYDTLARLVATNIKSSNAVPVTQFIRYTYGKTGALLSEQNENLSATYTYDELGRQIKATESTGAVKTYTYDIAGNRTAFVLKMNNVVSQNLSYAYDNLNRLIRVYENGVQKAAYGYDQNGNRITLTYSNGVQTTYVYNKANLVTSLTNFNSTGVLSSFEYTYYVDGNQASKTDRNGIITSYVYDGLRRLVSENVGGQIISYTYDTANNRSTMAINGGDVTSYTYDGNNRLITESLAESDGTETVTSYQYDNNGNQTAKTKIEYAGVEIVSQEQEQNTFDMLNRIVKVEKDGVTIGSYTYQPDGLRLSKTVDGVTTKHIWDLGNIVLDISGSTQNSYIRGINLISCNLYGFYLYNAHGDVVQLANEEAFVTKAYDYDAFGVEREISEDDTNPFRYCGEYFDKETEVVYLRARYYQASIGRFLSEDSHWNSSNSIYGDNPTKINEHKDPLGLNVYTYIPDINAINQSGNLYAYGLNNPLMYQDPNGEFAIVVEAAILLFGLAIIIAGAAIAISNTSTTGTTTMDFPIDTRPNNFIDIDTKDKAIPDVLIKDIPRRDNDPVYFPKNPYDFNPTGLVRSEVPGTKNGKLIFWKDIFGKDVFTWHENPNKKNGPHYHIPELDINIIRDKDKHHFYPGNIVPEPYATIYFRGGLF